VHKEEVDISDVIDKECLVTGWHHVARLLVGTETDLTLFISPCSLPSILAQNISQ
jgi:hypothetical protein